MTQIPAERGFITHPILDPVRAAALAAAVQYAGFLIAPPVPAVAAEQIEVQVLKIADRFCAWLAPTEADGQH